MTLELVAGWVRFYTRNLPPPIAERRIDEIDADLHDHIAHDRARGIKDWRIALTIAARMVRGMAADASWRRRTIARSASGKEVMRKNKTVAVRVALATRAAAAAIGLAAIVFGEADDAPGLVLFGCLLIVGTVALTVRTAQRSD